MSSPVIAPANVVAPASADSGNLASAGPAGVDAAADFAALLLAQVSAQAQLAADPELAELAALPTAEPADELTGEPPADAAADQSANDLAALLAAIVQPAAEPVAPIVAGNPTIVVPPAPSDSGAAPTATAAAMPAALPIAPPAALPATPAAGQSGSSPSAGAAPPKTAAAAPESPLQATSAKFADVAARLPATGTEPAAPANKTAAPEPLSSAAAPAPATGGTAGEASTSGPATGAYATIQPALGRAAVHTPAPTTAHLDTPLGDARWAADFGQRIVWLARQDVQAAQLSINPPHLGPIEISLTLGADQANAVFSSAHVEVRTALEAALPRLREMLASAGISLGDAQVNSQSQQQAGQHGQSAAGSSRWFAGSILEASADGTASGLLRQGAAVGLIDTFA